MARLHFYAIGDYARPAPGRSAPRRAAGRRIQPGPRGASWPRAAGQGPPSEERLAAGPEWALGAEWAPKTKLDIGADKWTSTWLVMGFNISGRTLAES